LKTSQNEVKKKNENGEIIKPEYAFEIKNDK
jgi:hypothetical protein